MLRALVFVLALAWPGTEALAQTAATLVADSVTVTADRTLVASGNVEVLFEGNRLSAAAIRYDQATDRLEITGPILIRAADGTIFAAQRATLDPALENGILIGARLVLAQQLQLAANQIDRVDGRYTQLQQVAATSCSVCAGRAPLWEIRARRVVHDEEEHQLYFDNATFLIRGTPVFWLPQMRLPDPTLTRATGLLIPRYRATDQLGTGIKIPYFIRLGDHRDLTLTPYLSANTKTLEARYRQAFLRGDLEIDLAVSRDTLIPGQDRGYVFASGNADLGKGFRLDYGLQFVSDDAYLVDYGYSTKDRLETFARVENITEQDKFLADLTLYQTLRTGEVNASLPPVVLAVSYEKRIEPDRIGGQLTYGAALDALYRTANTDGDAGRDVARIAAYADWTRSFVLPVGIVIETDLGADLTLTQTWQDSAYGAQALRSSQGAGVTLRWPLAAPGSRGGTHVIEPMIALAYSAAQGPAVANEDSTRTEFDEGNLLSFGRFAGRDATEAGAQAVAGLSWSRIGPAGTNSRLSFGRVWQADPSGEFTASSGLDTVASDWLFAGQLHFPSGLQVDGRVLFSDDFSPTKTAAIFGWDRGKVDLSASYVWLIADLAEDRAEPISEWTLKADYQVNDAWSVGLSGRYDVVTAQPARAGLRLGWQNECVTVDLSASRVYPSSTTIETTTDYGLSIGLNGFSAGRSGVAPRRACSN